MYPFPTFTDVVGAGTVLAAELRKGSAMDVGTVYHGAWVVAGYGGTFIPAPGTNQAGPNWTLDELANHLESACKAHASGVQYAVPWGTIALALLQLLAKILAGGVV